ncbi:MAG: (d)CMP kinase [Actinobacteria bacterium]|nr:(d)CMP kinase [Actinomycetota bacterium]
MNASNATRQKLVIAVDGPSGSGKSSISREAARRLGFNFLDTGAMYRMITYYLSSNGIENESEIENAISTKEINFGVSINPEEVQFKLNGEDVSKIIRTELISKKVSYYASLRKVRNFLVGKQRNLINESSKSIVIEGRDIGSVVIPDADLKIYVTASEEIRALRRSKELNSSMEQVLIDQKIRDEKDSKREISPLIKPDDSIELDTSSLTFEESVNSFIGLVQNV